MQPRRKIRPLPLVLAAMLCGTASCVAQTIDLRERLAACATCHGEHGEGAEGAEFYPHLAGKPAGYLLEQMQSFRDGRRHYPRMVYLMQYMDDAYLGEVAQWYASQPARTQRVASTISTLDPASAARAQQLVHQGDAAAGIPACAACHGVQLTGMEPTVPALVGLPPDYVVAQIGGWRTGVRASIAPDCMADIARQLSPGDIRIMATWLSEQNVAADQRPAPAGSWPLPADCGHLRADAASVPDDADVRP
jgi:cytochrome c553